MNSVIQLLTAKIAKAHDQGIYALACDEEACAHYEITLGPIEGLLWHSRLYVRAFAVSLFPALEQLQK